MALGVPIDITAEDRMEQIRHNIELLWKEVEGLAGLDGKRVRFHSPVDFRFKKIVGNLDLLPKAHKTTHQNGGTDEISVTGLSGELADDQPPKAHDNTKHSTAYQATSEKDAASGYAGLSASSRTTKGVDTTDDLIVDLATKGLVLKDTQGTPHYWRVTVSTLGSLTTTDIGTSKP